MAYRYNNLTGRMEDENGTEVQVRQGVMPTMEVTAHPNSIFAPAAPNTVSFSNSYGNYAAAPSAPTVRTAQGMPAPTVPQAKPKPDSNLAKKGGVTHGTVGARAQNTARPSIELPKPTVNPDLLMKQFAGQRKHQREMVGKYPLPMLPNVTPVRDLPPEIDLSQYAPHGWQGQVERIGSVIGGIDNPITQMVGNLGASLRGERLEGRQNALLEDQRDMNRYHLQSDLDTRRDAQAMHGFNRKLALTQALRNQDQGQFYTPSELEALSKADTEAMNFSLLPYKIEELQNRHKNTGFPPIGATAPERSLARQIAAARTNAEFYSKQGDMENAKIWLDKMNELNNLSGAGLEDDESIGDLIIPTRQ